MFKLKISAIFILLINFSCETDKNKSFNQEIIKNIYYVTSKNGLSIRTQPSLNSKKIGKFNYLDPVNVVKEYKNKTEIIYDNDIGKNVNGNWIMIEYNGINSFMFNGFLKQKDHLSKLAPLKPIVSEELLINGVLPFKTTKKMFLKHLGKPDSISGFKKGKEDYKKYTEIRKDSVLFSFRYVCCESLDYGETTFFDTLHTKTYYKNGISYEELNGKMYFLGIIFENTNFIKYRDEIWSESTKSEEIANYFPINKFMEFPGGLNITNKFMEFPGLNTEISWAMSFSNNNLSVLYFHYYD